MEAPQDQRRLGPKLPDDVTMNGLKRILRNHWPRALGWNCSRPVGNSASSSPQQNFGARFASLYFGLNPQSPRPSCLHKCKGVRFFDDDNDDDHRSYYRIREDWQTWKGKRSGGWVLPTTQQLTLKMISKSSMHTRCHILISSLLSFII